MVIQAWAFYMDLQLLKTQKTSDGLMLKTDPKEGAGITITLCIAS